MKLILSRKGFDSAHGRVPNPILNGDTLCPIPIPDPGSPTPYGAISFNGFNVGEIVESLTRGRIKGRDGAHLDPDLRRHSIARGDGWRPLFGQAGAAQSHLTRHQVGPGDVFLFFGWFQRAEKIGSAFRSIVGAPKMHVIYGWLEVGRVAAASDGFAAEVPWARGHPHLAEPSRYKNNTLYIASDRLSSLGMDACGGGAFGRLRPELILTQTDPYLGCSRWRLPRWFEPRGRTPLSYHCGSARWRRSADATSVALQSAYPGQEFVLDVDEYPEARGWLRALFRNVDQ